MHILSKIGKFCYQLNTTIARIIRKMERVPEGWERIATYKTTINKEALLLLELLETETEEAISQD